MNKEELLNLLQKLFKSGEIEIHLESEDQFLGGNYKNIFPVVYINDEVVFTGSGEYVEDVERVPF